MSNKIKYLLISIMIFVIILSTVSCTKTVKVQLDYLKKPQTAVLQGDLYNKEILELGEKLKRAKDDKERQVILSQINEYTKKSSIDASDLIEYVFDEISDKEGKIGYKLDNRLKDYKSYCLIFDYGINTTIEMINAGYIDSIYLFEDNTVILPRYDQDSETLISSVVVRVSKEVYEKIDEFFVSNIR